MNVIGTCSICNGPVTVPEYWGGAVPPAPTCAKCGAIKAQPYGQVVPMQRGTQQDFREMPENLRANILRSTKGDKK